MKKLLCFLMLAALMLGLVGCKEDKQVTLPPHKVLGASASLEGTDGLTGAYILATDTAINILANKMFKDTDDRPQYISLDFATSFALKKAGKEKLLSALEVYGIPVDDFGEIAHNGLKERNQGFVIQYPVGGQHNTQKSDFTITVEVLYKNYGYAYYFDFNIFGDRYVMVNYENGYEKVR